MNFLEFELEQLTELLLCPKEMCDAVKQQGFR